MNVNFDIRPDGGIVQKCTDPKGRCPEFEIVFKGKSFSERKAFQEQQMRHGSLATRLAAANKKMDAGFDGGADDFDARVDRLAKEIEDIHEEMIPATSEIADAAVDSIVGFPNGFKIGGKDAEYNDEVRDQLIAGVPGFLDAVINGFSELNGLSLSNAADEPDSGNSRSAPKHGRRRR